MEQAARAGIISSAPFGTTRSGVQVALYSLRNSRGMEANITNYGGIVTRLTVPDRNGQFADVVLGHNWLDEYIEDNSPYFGALIGR